MIEHPMITQIEKFGYPREFVEQDWAVEVEKEEEDEQAIIRDVFKRIDRTNERTKGN